jgi:hypothetical protein
MGLALEPLSATNAIRVKITGRAGELLIDGVGYLMRHPAPVLRRRSELQTQKLLAGVDVPQAEIDAQASVAVAHRLPREQRLSVDRLPLVERRLDVHVRDLFLEGAGIDGPEQLRTAKIGGDDLTDPRTDRSPTERRDSDRQRLGRPLIDVDDDIGGDRRCEGERGGHRGEESQESHGYVTPLKPDLSPGSFPLP